MTIVPFQRNPMTTPINDGGPAFPVAPEHNGYPRDAHGPGYGTGTGMSLRDYFAAQAIAGMLANPELDGDFPVFARDAYRYADALLATRHPKE